MLSKFIKTYNDIKNRKYLKSIKRIRSISQQLNDSIDLISYVRENIHDKDKVFAAIIYSIKINKSINIYDTQLLGALLLSEGNLIQMNTGEGKTITSVISAIYMSLKGHKVIIVTTNDYLVLRDSNVNKEVFDSFELDVGITSDKFNLIEKKANYSCNIIYTTASQLGFDYLRDNQVMKLENKVQCSLDFVIIDEVDSILIDEATVPLIISKEDTVINTNLKKIDSFTKILKLGEVIKSKDFMDDSVEETNDFILEDTCYLTEQGLSKAEEFFNLKNKFSLADKDNIYHHIIQSIVSNYKMTKGVEYIVKNNEIVLIDKNTGRLVPGRKISGGLHQALEAKENLTISSEYIASARITYQSFFKKFKILSGMSGTLITETEEFSTIYNLSPVEIEPNKPLNREDHKDILFKNKVDKDVFFFDIVAKEHKKGRPILIGTSSVNENIFVYNKLKEMKIKCTILNAENEYEEADIISKAGNFNSVTVATNMAGRGVDIVIDKESLSLGGLLVIGYSKNNNRRIDNQLKGRSGRQGDVGESLILASLDDELFNKFNDLVNKIKKTNRIFDDKNTSFILNSVQSKLEDAGFRNRKNLMDFDETQSKQMFNFYKLRDQILSYNYDEIENMLNTMIDKVLEEMSLNGNIDKTKFKNIFNIDYNKSISIKDKLLSKFKYMKRESSKDILRELFLQKLDEKWILFLEQIDSVLDGISFVSNIQKDPKIEFKRISFNLYGRFLKDLKYEIIKSLISIEVDKGNSDVIKERTISL